MDDPEANQTPGENFNKIDLSALEAFQFGTQWTGTGDPKRHQDDAGGGGSSRGGSDAPSRRDRRPPRRTTEGGGGGGDHGREPSSYDTGSGGGYPPRESRGPRPGGGGGYGRGQRREGGERFSRGPGFDHDRRGGGGGGGRFERGGGGGERFERGPRRPAGPPRPYESPVLEVTFYPDDHGFTALVKAMRASCRTYELFEIARLILGKPERCVVVFRRRAAEGAAPEAPRAPLAISVPTGVPFDTEEEAIGYTLEKHLGQFFTSEVVEGEPPKGTFQFVNRCPLTKELLGPPNYHRYPQLLQQHYTTRGIRMPFDRFKASVEVVRDPEVVNQWLESMKKTTRYTYIGDVPEGETGVFDNLEDARAFLLRTARDRVVRTADTARVAAKVVEAAAGTEAFRAMNGAVDMQRRFPLDTANALRGRLRRENFNIFKRGSKGVTYVCSVRRKFRQPGQSFSESINRLIVFLDANPMIAVTELPMKMLGFAPPPPPPAPAAPPPAAAPAPAPTPAEAPAAPATAAPEEAAASNASGPVASAPEQPAEPAPTPAPTASALTPEQTAALNRLMLDLRWLVAEGYVAEYSDGRLSAHPVMEPQVAKAAAAADHAAESAADPTEGAADAGAATEAPAESSPESSSVEASGAAGEAEASQSVAKEEPPAPEAPASAEEKQPPAEPAP